MGGCCSCCCDGKSDFDDDELEKAGNHKYGKSWADGMTLEEKKKVAKENAHADCLFCKCCGIFGAWSGLRCCCCHFTNEQPFLSIKTERHCTDIPCCLLFLVTLVVQFALVIYAVTNLQADPRWLIYYADLYGNICAPEWDSFDIAFNVSTAGNYAAWPDIRMYDVRVCIDECNETVIDDRIVTPSWDSDLNVDIDPLTGVAVDISGYETINVFDAYCIPDPEYVSQIASNVLEGDFESFEDNLDALTEAITLAINDVQTTRLLFVISAITALLISMAWGWLIRKIGAIIIWLSIGFTLLGMGLMAYFLIEYSQYAFLFGYDNIGNFMYYSGWILGIIDGMFALAVCFMWNRIRLAIALAKETTRALQSLWTMFLYPIVPFATFICYFVYWLIGGIYMGSVTVEKEWPMPEGYKLPYYDGGPTLQSKLNLPSEGATYVYLEVDEQWQYILLFHFFVLLWMTHFISYHTYMVIAGVYAEWYFADWKDEKETKKWRGSDEEVLVIGDKAIRDDSDLERAKDKNAQLHAAGIDQTNPEMKTKEEMKTIAKLSYMPVLASFKRVTWYHMGTLAFASLLIAIIEFIEYTLTYFEKKFRNSEPSPMQKLILALIKCLLRCIKCILNRINRNGLIITSIYGWPFCAASMKGIAIVLKNVVRASALTMVSGYLEKLGKICILSLNIGFSIAFCNYYYEGQISSILLPALLCAAITFVICWQYMHLYEVGISAIFICFLIDEERNKSLQEMKASKRLRKIIGAQKPPKKYLIDQAKSVRGAGLMNTHQVEHFKKASEVDPRDLRAMASVGNLRFETEIHDLKGAKSRSHSHSMSISIDEDHQKQITEFEEEQRRTARGNQHIQAMEIETNMRKHVK